MFFNAKFKPCYFRLFKSLQEPNPKDTPDTKDGSTEVKTSNGCVEHSTPMEVDDKSKTDQVDVEVVEWVKEADQPETSKDGQNDEGKLLPYWCNIA